MVLELGLWKVLRKLVYLEGNGVLNVMVLLFCGCVSCRWCVCKNICVSCGEVFVCDSVLFRVKLLYLLLFKIGKLVCVRCIWIWCVCFVFSLVFSKVYGLNMLILLKIVCDVCLLVCMCMWCLFFGVVYLCSGDLMCWCLWG